MQITYSFHFQDPIDAVHLIQNLTDNRDEGKVDAATILYLLGDTLNRFNSTDGEAQEELSQVRTLIRGGCNNYNDDNYITHRSLLMSVTP